MKQDQPAEDGPQLPPNLVVDTSSGLNRLGGDVSLPSQSQSSQPILPTVVVPSPPAILTNPEAEDHDEDLELPKLEQEETTGSPSKKQKTGKKKKKPDDTMMSHLSILPEMNIHLHLITIRTIQQPCRYNMKVRKN